MPGDAVIAATIGLGGLVFATLWAWRISVQKDHNKIFSTSQNILIKGYHDLIEDARGMMLALREETKEAERRSEERCESRILLMEASVRREMRDHDAECASQLYELRSEIISLKRNNLFFAPNDGEQAPQ